MTAALRTWLALALLAVTTGCTDVDEKGYESREVHSQGYGDRWPLTVDSAAIACSMGALKVTVDGRSWIIPNTSSGADVPRGLDRVWARDLAGDRLNFAPLYDDALDLCN